MGCGSVFCSMAKTLLKSATARVNVNKELMEAFKLTRSNRQECPFAPLLYAIASSGLTWLVKDKIEKGELKGIHIENQSQICLECLQMTQTPW